MRTDLRNPSALGVMLASNESLFIHCSNVGCNHFGRVDMQRLIARLGADFDLVLGRERLLATLRCPKCGRRPRSLSRSPDNRPMSSQPHHGRSPGT